MSERTGKLAIETVTEPDACLVRLRGEVDLRTSPQLRTALLAALQTRPQRLILDLAGVPYMDSSGVGTIVETKRRADHEGSRLVLTGLQPRVRSVFEITQLTRFLSIASTLDAARTL